LPAAPWTCSAAEFLLSSVWRPDQRNQYNFGVSWPPIAAQDDSWETMVPREVAELIKRRSFFGYGR
jgi:hypothetical protein